MNNILCKCGHDFEDHILDNDGQLTDEDKARCMFCYLKGDFSIDGCNGYIPDNLKYLQMRYERKLCQK